MRESLQLQLPPTEVQSLSQGRTIADPSAGKTLSPTAILVKAVSDERTLLNGEEDAARTQGYEPSYWSKIKAGDRPAQLERVARLPVGVQKRFVRRYARALGMDVREETPQERQRRALANLAYAIAEAQRELVS